MVLRRLFEGGGVVFRFVADRGRSSARGRRAGDGFLAELGLGARNFGEVGFLGFIWRGLVGVLGCGLVGDLGCGLVGDGDFERGF